MKTKLRKIGALVIASSMALALGGTVLAANEADMDGESGVIGEFEDPDTPEEQAAVLKIYKEITAYNPETCEVNAPTITYSYTIEPGSAEKDIYDDPEAHAPEGSVHVQTKAGVGDPIIICYGDEDGNDEELNLTTEVKLNASVDGEKNAFPISIDFSGIDFTDEDIGGTGAGVYRYVITESSEDKASAGINDGDISDTRYIDVYVDGEGKIYGYVCFAYDNDINASGTATDDDKVSQAYKTEGFVAGVDTSTGSSTSTGDAVAADEYYTFNFELTKVLENDSYSQNHEFPFTITLENDDVTVDVLPIMEIHGNASQDDLDAGPIAGTWEPTIANDGLISYVGIPCGTTVTITETNDVYGVTYALTIENADNEIEAMNIAYDETSEEAVIDCGAAALTAAEENHTESDAGTVTFTNTLKQISPTGVIVRYAPYILLLGAGAALFVLSRRWKKKEEA